MEFKDLLETYKTIEEQIFTAFGVENGYGEIDMDTEVKWKLTKDSVYWMDGGNLYSCELRSDIIYYHENYALMYVDNGCGDQYYMLFNTDLKDETIDEENY